MVLQLSREIHLQTALCLVIIDIRADTPERCEHKVLQQIPGVFRILFLWIE
ncbi:MAG: hypothetical protein GXP53_04445 [Deltaproteobacteria bacterium]|nr:hypothetical protein [Deltaproteobacteria bacterium]